MQHWKSILVAAAITASTAYADQVDVINADFENGPMGRGVDILGWDELDSPDLIEPGGYTANVNGIFILGDQMPASPTGGRFAVLRNSPYKGLVEAISQEMIGLDPARSYAVRFYQANAGLHDFRPGIPDGTGPGHFEISLGDETFVSSTTEFNGFGSQIWTAVEVIFEPSQSELTLELRAAGFIGGLGNTGRLALDGLSICVVPNRCTPADLAPPFGVLDLADINAFTAGFLSMDPIADLTADGLFDLADINLFVSSFVAGCP